MSDATAIFLGWMEGYEEIPPLALYNVLGGEHHGGTVTAETLQTLKIDVPATPAYEDVAGRTAGTVRGKCDVGFVAPATNKEMTNGQA